MYGGAVARNEGSGSGAPSRMRFNDVATFMLGAFCSDSGVLPS